MAVATDVILSLQPCSTCGRTFNPDTLARHELICAKNAHSSTRRKPFDTRKQRLRGIELETYRPSQPASQSEAKYAAQKKDNWRRKHEEFIQSIRSARSFTSPGTPSVAPNPNPDYVQCSYCQRRFEPTTAERHIPFCKEQANRLDRKPSSGTKASESLNKRIGYKPPPLKKKSAPGSRTTPSRPPGSSLIMQNTNFKNTYTLEQTPPTSNDLPPKPSKKGNGTSIKKAGPTVDSTRRQSLNQATPINTKYGEGVLQQKMKTTSFSRVKRSVVNPGTKSPRDFYSDNSNPHSPNTKYTSTMHLRDLHRNQQQCADRPPEQPKMSSSSQRLFAALEYSDQSSDDGSGHFGDGCQTDRSNRGRHLTHVLNDEIINGCDSYSQDESPAAYRTSGLVEGVVMPSSRDPPTGNNAKYHSGSTTRSNSSKSSAPLNEFGMPMSKFCYECGAKFPVPQAKYCCECGTKRI